MQQDTLELSQRTCQEYAKGTPPLGQDEIARYQPSVPDWTVADGKRLHKAYRFNNFANALALVNRIGAVAEEQDHHPDLQFGWGRVEVDLTTHSVGGLFLNDFILAAKIEVLIPGAPGLWTG